MFSKIACHCLFNLQEMVGGVLAIKPDQFRAANGLSNRFFGWGGEDDDFYLRLLRADLAPVRLAARPGRYVALKHTKQSPAPNLHHKLQQV